MRPNFWTSLTSSSIPRASRTVTESLVGGPAGRVRRRRQDPVGAGLTQPLLRAFGMGGVREDHAPCARGTEERGRCLRGTGRLEPAGGPLRARRRTAGTRRAGEAPGRPPAVMPGASGPRLDRAGGPAAREWADDGPPGPPGTAARADSAQGGGWSAPGREGGRRVGRAAPTGAPAPERRDHPRTAGCRGTRRAVGARRPQR